MGFQRRAEPPFQRLTPTQVDVLREIVVNNLSLREAAEKLGIQYNTIGVHMARIRLCWGLDGMKTDDLRWELRCYLGLEPLESPRA